MNTIDTVIKHAMEQVREERPTWRPTEEQIAAEIERLAKRGYLPHEEKAIRTLAAWIAWEREGLARKGVLLHGPPGTGKTLWMKMVPVSARFFTAPQIVDAWRECDGFGDAFDERIYGAYHSGTLHVTGANNCLVIDDLGSEPVGVRYGQQEDVLVRVISDRYRHWCERGALRGGRYAMTHFTTNLDLPALVERYDARTADRMRSMCQRIEFTGTSHR